MKEITPEEKRKLEADFAVYTEQGNLHAHVKVTNAKSFVIRKISKIVGDYL